MLSYLFFLFEPESFDLCLFSQDLLLLSHHSLMMLSLHLSLFSLHLLFLLSSDALLVFVIRNLFVPRSLEVLLLSSQLKLSSSNVIFLKSEMSLSFI